MVQFDQMTPDQHRERYEALRATARARAGAPPSAPPPARFDSLARLRSEAIPAGWYCTVALRRGEALRIVNTSGTDGVAALFWNAHDTSERFNAGDTVKLQWTARLGPGRVLFSDMGRVLLSIIADTSGRHDALCGGGRRPGAGSSGSARSTPDNFRLGAGKHGLGRADIPSCITFFAPVLVAPDGGLGWEDGRVSAGQLVDLRAEMDVLAVLSNCPHPLSPRAEAAGPIEVIIWRPPPPADDDQCRCFGEEAERGFQNTEAVR